MKFVNERDSPRTCPVCGATSPSVHAGEGAGSFLRCAACGSLYLAAAPDLAALHALYQSPTYHDGRGHSGDEAIEATKTVTARGYLRLLERCRPPGRRYLEVGCSTGAHLSAAASAGWEAQGIEISAAAAAIARRRPGLEARVHAGTVHDAPYQDASFDAIAMFDVIEHVDPPQPMLRKAYELLAAGGLLLLVTPDAGSWSARLLGRHWPHLIPEHVISFSRGALTRVLEQRGFEVLRTRFAWKWINLDMLFRHAHLHGDVVGARLLRALQRLLPTPVARCMFPFNIGEFYVVARRPRGMD